MLIQRTTPRTDFRSMAKTKVEQRSEEAAEDQGVR